MERTLLPSEREEQAAQEKARLEQISEARAKELRRDFALTFQTEHGKRVLQWLRQRTGHNKVILSANRSTGAIDPLLTTFAAMELNLYLEIRNHLPQTLLTEVENGNSIRASGDISDNGSSRGRGESPTRTKRGKRRG